MILKIKTIPGAGKNEIIEEAGGQLRVKIKEKPEKGRANIRVINILSRYFKIPEEKIKIISGLKNRNKIIKISDNV